MFLLKISDAKYFKGVKCDYCQIPIQMIRSRQTIKNSHLYIIELGSNAFVKIKPGPNIHESP